jgi:ribose 5-phosphate isomerase A
MDVDAQKRQAAAKALEFVRPGMRLGLGTGSTAKHFVDLLAERVRGGLDIVGVPTSAQTRSQAESLGVPLTTLDVEPELDLTIDGADEVDGDLHLIKGGGGALLREKIVARASKTMIVIVDESKLVPVLGRFPLPIEVIAFGLAATQRHIEACAGPAQCVLRHNAAGHAFVTDEGHCILDAALHRIQRPEELAACLVGIPGVVEHGLFIGMADLAIISSPEGVRIVERATSSPRIGATK